MKISVTLVDGFLNEKYSKFAPDEFKLNGTPIVSFPIKLEEIPAEAKSLALTFIDYDSIPVCGFAWIHWTAANIPAHIAEIPENASAKEFVNMVQGTNSCASPIARETDRRIICRYAGPTPPDKDHKYTLTVYALDSILDLKEGFYLNEFMEKINGHIIQADKFIIPARCKQ